MLSVGKFAELAQVSTRTVRFYESIGLLPPSKRRENNYRYYDKKWLERMEQIRDLQSLGFSLEEVKKILLVDSFDFNSHLYQRLSEIDSQVENLQAIKMRLIKLLSVAQKIELHKTVTETERTLYMEAIREKIIDSMKGKYSHITESEMAYFERDHWIHHQPQVKEFFEAVQKCVDFAQKNNLKLGPGRGSSPASISLFGLGFSHVDPMKYTTMIPERLTSRPPNLHIDVEFERGQNFIDYCREINRTLTFGEIHAFKMPLIDIIQNVHKELNHVIDYESIDDNSELVLGPLKKLDLDKIFQIDYSEDALIMKYEGWEPEYYGLHKMTEYLQQAPIQSFRDLINITAVWRPNCSEMKERIQLYAQAKNKMFTYDFLPEVINDSLKENFGLVLYHEDLMRIIHHFTGWDFGRCNQLRILCLNTKSLELKNQNDDWLEFVRKAPSKVVALVEEESQWTFCLPHAIAFAQLTKQTLVLKSLHKKVYLEQIEKFEQKFGYRWDDIGVKLKGISLLQD